MRIKEVIKENGFTLEQVATKLNKSKSGMSQIVNNDNTPPQTLRKIAEVIGCDVAEFFLDECKKNIGIIKEDGFVCPKCGAKLSIGITISER